MRILLKVTSFILVLSSFGIQAKAVHEIGTSRSNQPEAAEPFRLIIPITKESKEKKAVEMSLYVLNKLQENGKIGNQAVLDFLSKPAPPEDKENPQAKLAMSGLEAVSVHLDEDVPYIIFYDKTEKKNYWLYLSRSREVGNAVKWKDKYFTAELRNE
ncbi:hypothetical protein GW915_12575 [bacterium]|nr:hypothetical protein [bacterium]